MAKKKKVDLKQYLEEKGIKKIHFAKTIGVTPAWLHRILKGHDIPLSLAATIEEKTDKRVPIKRLLDTILEKKPAFGCLEEGTFQNEKT